MQTTTMRKFSTAANLITTNTKSISESKCNKIKTSELVNSF